MSKRPIYLAVRPRMSVHVKADALSEVLRAVRLTGAVYFDCELISPWAAEALRSREIVADVMPGAQRVIEYRLIARGSCWGHATGQPPVHLREGDLIVLLQGDAQVLSSDPGTRAHIVCCFLGCDERPCHPLLSALPAVIHLSTIGAQATARWLGTLLTMAVRESGSARAGGENVLARLSELMFVETIRCYLETRPSVETGWLAGLQDPVVGPALAALHGDARERWTVEQLARVAGVSRSVFAERFTAVIGHPPMQYLAQWRMQIASRLLIDGGRVSTVADAVGYESEAAFSRAFKKLVGEAPATWRDATLSLPSRDAEYSTLPDNHGVVTNA
jgi:AraC-like DNA-binding protein